MCLVLLIILIMVLFFKFNPLYTKEETARLWLNSHPYLQPYSRNYNLKLANDVSDFINKLDSYLYDSNQEHSRFSKDYYNIIDNYIYSVLNNGKYQWGILNE